tara:strand:- start:468 stop:794 length:327 start_codon:yes stop_codon:yes gene_type:complete
MSLDFYIKQNDSSPTIRASLKGAGGTSINLSTATVSFRMQKSSGDNVVQGSAQIFDATEGIVQYSWVAGNTSVSGIYLAEFEVTYADGRVESFPNVGYIQVNIKPELS